MSTHILVVDDEKELAGVLELYLVNDGCTVRKRYTGPGLPCAHRPGSGAPGRDAPRRGRLSALQEDPGEVPHHHAHSQGVGRGQDHGPDHRGRRLYYKILQPPGGGCGRSWTNPPEAPDSLKRYGGGYTINIR